MEKLRETGSVYVTPAAAHAYAAHERCSTEAARRQLTMYLLDATPVGDGDSEDAPTLWRYRRRSTGLDISARVLHEDGLAIVVSISVCEDSRL